MQVWYLQHVIMVLHDNYNIACHYSSSQLICKWRTEWHVWDQLSQSVSQYLFFHSIHASLLLFWQAPLVVCSAISSSVSSAESYSISSLGKRRLDGWPCTWYEVVPLWQTVLPCVRAWVQIAAVTLSVNSLRQTVHTHRASVTKQWNWYGNSSLKGCKGYCGPGRKYWQPAVRFMTHVTCRLTAKNRDQLRNPTLGNWVWATFTLFLHISH